MESRKPGYCETGGELVAVLASGVFALALLALTVFLFVKYTSEFFAVTLAGVFVAAGVLSYRKMGKSPGGSLFGGVVLVFLSLMAVNVIQGVL